jgi:hypothetical protein
MSLKKNKQKTIKKLTKAEAVHLHRVKAAEPKAAVVAEIKK